jgi:hypothetical protein
MGHEKITTQATDGANRRRSERVMLKVSVLLSVTSKDGMVINESTCTQVVNAHGGLLGLEMEIFAGESFLLTNSKTGVSRECSVVRTQPSPGNRGFLIAFQFATPSPDFWPVVFPPKDWQALESQAIAQEK